jgi:hypothetical protein
VQDYLDALEWPGDELCQLAAGLLKMRIGNDSNFHIGPIFF